MVRTPFLTSFTVDGSEFLPVLESAVMDLVYINYMYGKPSLLEITLDVNNDVLALLTQGAFIQIRFAYEDTPNDFVDTGFHSIDTIEKQELPTTIKVGGIGYTYISDLESTEPIWRRNNTLSQLVNELVTAYNLQLTGNPSATTTVGTRPTPDQFTEVRFSRPLDLLYTLGREYGYSVQIKGNQLNFQSFDSLDPNPISGFFTPSDIGTVIQSISSSFQRYSLVFAKYDNDINDEPLWASSGTSGGGVFYLDGEGYYWDISSATRRSLGKRLELNNDASTFKFRTTGEYWHQAGINVQVSAMEIPENTGKYRVYKTTHQLSSNGWDCELELQKIS